MRRTNLLFCYLFLAFTFAGASATLLAADLGSPRQSYPGDRQYSDEAKAERELAAFCYGQGQICRKICRMHDSFDESFDGCPQSCESRAGRCTRTGCYRWTDPDFLIAEKFGGDRCAAL